VPGLEITSLIRPLVIDLGTMLFQDASLQID